MLQPPTTCGKKKNQLQRVLVVVELVGVLPICYPLCVINVIIFEQIWQEPQPVGHVHTELKLNSVVSMTAYFRVSFSCWFHIAYAHEI